MKWTMNTALAPIGSSLERRAKEALNNETIARVKMCARPEQKRGYYGYIPVCRPEINRSRDVISSQ